MKATITLAKKVTINELEAILSNQPDSIGTFATITQLTEPKITKKVRGTKEVHNIQKVEKLTTLQVLLSTKYEAGVLNQLKRESKEKTEYKKGENTMPLDLCENNNFFGYYKGAPVIQYRPFDNSKPETTYFVDGKETPLNEIPDILPVRSKAKNQGTDKEIFWRKVYLKNIKSITINKQTYEVV